MTTVTSGPQIGDRYVYITPSGRREPYTVKAIDVEPKHQNKPGLCVFLVSDNRKMRDVTCWPTDLRNHFWERQEG